MQLIQAVQYIHQTGIIHRDLKPENILVLLNQQEDRIEQIKLIDFGFSQMVSPNDLLYEGCGTPNYVAPEVLKGEGYNKTSDIFSLGVSMYFM